MPFARKMALRYNYTNEPLDDLVQVACVGLLKALDRFDPDRGHRFMSFAAPTILGELKRHFRDKGWGVHVPRDLQEQALTMGRAKERLSQNLGHSPTVQELANALGWPLEQVLEAGRGRPQLRDYVARRPRPPAARVRVPHRSSTGSGVRRKGSNSPRAARRSPGRGASCQTSSAGSWRCGACST